MTLRLRSLVAAGTKLMNRGDLTSRSCSLFLRQCDRPTVPGKNGRHFALFGIIQLGISMLCVSVKLLISRLKGNGLSHRRSLISLPLSQRHGCQL